MIERIIDEILKNPENFENTIKVGLKKGILVKCDYCNKLMKNEFIGKVYHFCCKNHDELFFENYCKNL